MILLNITSKISLKIYYRHNDFLRVLFCIILYWPHFQIVNNYGVYCIFQRNSWTKQWSKTPIIVCMQNLYFCLNPIYIVKSTWFEYKSPCHKLETLRVIFWDYLHLFSMFRPVVSFTASVPQDGYPNSWSFLFSDVHLARRSDAVFLRVIIVPHFPSFCRFAHKEVISLKWPIPEWVLSTCIHKTLRWKLIILKRLRLQTPGYLR